MKKLQRNFSTTCIVSDKVELVDYVHIEAREMDYANVHRPVFEFEALRDDGDNPGNLRAQNTVVKALTTTHLVMRKYWK